MQNEHLPAGDRRVMWLGAALVALIAAVPRVLRAWESIPDTLARSTPDDAYYYFAISRNIVDGNGVSFDGENVTNGFHPLWLALITPFWVFDGGTPIHLALTLGAIFGAVTAAIIFVWITEATGNLVASSLAAGFFALHPAIVTDSVNGIETPLVVMLLAVAVLVLSRLLNGSSPARRGEHWRQRIVPGDLWLGLVCGLLLLSRTDMIFVVGAMLIFVLIREGWRDIVRPIASGTVAAACVLPWLVWSYAATGSIVQISGKAGGVLVRESYRERHGDALWTNIKHGVDLSFDQFTTQLPRSYFVPSEVSGWLFVAAVPLVVVLIGWAALKTRGPFAVGALVLVVVAVGFLMGLGYHSGIRWFWRTWYFAPASLIGSLALGLAVHAAHTLILAAFPRAHSQRPLVMGGLAVVAAAAMVVAYQPHQAMSWTGEQTYLVTMYEGSRWLSENTPLDARAGSFNGGIIGYYSERTVFNLDGVVNEDAYEALKSCKITEYVRDERISYVVDWQGALILANCGPPVVDYEVAEAFPTDTSFGTLQVLAVTPATE